MNLIPLRTAAIAGTCAVALSFVALPAYAAVPFDEMSSTTDSSQTTAPDDTATVPTDDSTTPTDDSTTDDSTTDDSTTGTDDGSDVSDDNGSDSDSTDDGNDDTTPVVTLPAEKGKPKAHYVDTVLTPKAIAKKGVKVVYTGLTAGKKYQPYYFVPEAFGDSYGKELTASKKGTLTVTYTWKKVEPSFDKLGAVYDVGLLGVDTAYREYHEIAVKYDSDLKWNAAVRHGKKVTLSVSVDKDDAKGKSSDWKKTSVEFQKKVGTKWVTVKTVKTNAKGSAEVTLKAGVSTWRAVLAGSTTVIGATSHGHRK